MKDEKLMLKQAELLLKDLESLADICPPELISRMQTVISRAKEYADRSFVILVAGPVKSGKSTFVNLLANAFVSPTHFLECTVRPSIISASKENEGNLITVYKSENLSRVVEQVDAIIDSLRSMIKVEDIPQVTRQEWPLTPENIDEHVALDVSDISTDGTLMTTIKTPGGKLLTDGVYLIDMPGFDGSKANLDSPLYRTIASRADLIILVQSSNSAITKVSEEFFSLLRDNNRNVPVCLLHNVFDAAYWRGDEQKKAAVNEHMAYAIARIKEMGFNLDTRNAYAVNLGMVWDWRDRQYVSDSEVLETAVEVYDRVEQEMFDVLLTQRDSIRLRTVLGRTLQQMEHLIIQIEAGISNLRTRLERHRQVSEMFARLFNRDIKLKSEANVDWLALRNELTGIYTLTKKSLSGRYNTAEARELVAKFIDDCSKTISKKMGEALKLLDAQINAEDMILYRSAVAETLRETGVDEPLPQLVMPAFKALQPELSVLEVKKIVKWNPIGYSVTKINDCLAHVYYYLVGKEDSTDVGYISFMLPEELDSEVKEHVRLMHNRIDETYGNFLKLKQKEALNALLPDPMSASKELDNLMNLYGQLKKLYTSTENAMKS